MTFCVQNIDIRPIKSWEDNWDNLSTFFTFPGNIRKIIYTTNVIESLNSQFRKITKTKLIFPNYDSLMKMLYLAVERVARKWSRAYADWDLVINQLNIIFSDIFPSVYYSQYVGIIYI